MAEIFDIVQRIDYEVKDGGLKQATTELTNQIKSIGVLSTRLDRLQKLLDSTASNDIQKRQRIISLINQQKQAIDNQNKAIDTQIKSNKQLQEALTKEIGLINLLDMRYKALQEDKKKASSVEEIKAITRELGNVEKQLGRLNGVGKGGGIFSQLKSGLVQGLGLGAGFGVAGLVAGGVSQVTQFLEESGRIAAEAEGVKRAFDALNQPDLLSNLRKATRGTVSDLELMKQTIAFSNFGLPVEKLSIALDFARRRARDTGQSVDYLVQSIVTGVGRQSPLILDNLGISAKRVSDEFKRTGNFADAAFKIISEESAKAGKDLDTFAEKQAQLNAKFENQQAVVGEAYNTVKGYVTSFLADLVSEGNFTITKQFYKSREEAQKLAEEEKKINAQANTIFLQQFQIFAENYVQGDYKAREQIKENARKQYDDLLRQVKGSYLAQVYGAEVAVAAINKAYQRLNGGFKSAVNVKSLTAAGLQGLSKEQLLEAQQSIATARSPLTSADKGEIARLNVLDAVIKKELDAINGTPAQTNTSRPTRLDPELKRAKDLKDTLDKVRQSFSEITDKQVSEGANEVANRAGMVFFTKNGKKNGTSDYYSSDEYQTALLKFNVDAAKKQEQIDKDTADRAKAAKEQQQQQIRDLRDAYLNLGQTVAQAYGQILQAQAQMLDFQLQAQETRVAQATRLAERGNTEQLRIETERLDQIQKKREQNAQQQLEINALLQASNNAVSLSEAIGAVVGAAAKGDPYTIALRIAAAVSALIAGIASIKAAFYDGGYTGDGDPKDTAGIVHKKEFVMPAHITADPENRRVLEAMYAGTYKPQEFATPTVITGKALDYKETQKLLREISEKMEGQNVSVKQSLDAHGFSQAVETYKRKDQQKWS